MSEKMTPAEVQIAMQRYIESPPRLLGRTITVSVRRIRYAVEKLWILNVVQKEQVFEALKTLAGEEIAVSDMPQRIQECLTGIEGITREVKRSLLLKLKRNRGE